MADKNAFLVTSRYENDRVSEILKDSNKNEEKKQAKAIFGKRRSSNINSGQALS